MQIKCGTEYYRARELEAGATCFQYCSWRQQTSDRSTWDWLRQTDRQTSTDIYRQVSWWVGWQVEDKTDGPPGGLTTATFDLAMHARTHDSRALERPCKAVTESLQFNTMPLAVARWIYSSMVGQIGSTLCTQFVNVNSFQTRGKRIRDERETGWKVSHNRGFTQKLSRMRARHVLHSEFKWVYYYLEKKRERERANYGML